MGTVVVDDHVLRDVLAGERPSDLGLGADRLATTGLWLFRLSASLADPTVAGRLSAPVTALAPELRERFQAQVVALPAEIEILHLRALAWSMAGLQQRHRVLGHGLSAAMVEVLAAAHVLDADIAVSADDLGPNLRAAAIHDGIGFHVLTAFGV